MFIGMLMLAGSVSAQHRFGTTDGVDKTTMAEKEFLQFDENTVKYFWAVDLGIFNAGQKSAFQDLVFKSDLLVAISTPDANNYWYLASYRTVDKELVITEIKKLIDQSKNLSTNSQDKYK